MNSVTLNCPACLTPLRLRDPEMLRQAIDCPECGESIPPVAPVENDVPPERPVGPLEELDAVPKATEDVTLPPTSATGRPLDRFASPVVVAWSSAAVVSAILLGLYLTGDGDSSPEPTKSDDQPVADTDTPLNPAETAGVPAANGHMQRLAERLLAHRSRTDRLPIDAGPEHAGAGVPLSWLARLEAFDSLGGLEQPDWSRSYDDLRNADFVRRERVAFLNPAVETTRSPDGEPVTHFVGVAGVGEDAPTLPASHSRAGMFGFGRSSGLDDVGDGLANTMMVAGVRTNLGSWAAAGSGTIRPFVAEPYVNGPDGFGTGQPDGMLVLMGDGSVRTVSAVADPRVVRRMAAANDGLDLDLVRPGEPGDRVSEPPPPVEVVRNDPPPDVAPPMPDPMPDPVDSDPPVDVQDPLPPALPELPKWTPALVSAKLSQPLGSFRTSKPVVAEDLLNEVAEMCGVPIHADPKAGVDFAVFERQVSLSIEKGTVATVLDALLAKLDLAYVVADDGIHLRPVDAPSEEP